MSKESTITIPETEVLQPDYGVKIPLTEVLQPDYGVKIPLTEVLQPDYGVKIPLTEVLQPDYGAKIPIGLVQSDINISYAELENNISTLKEAIAVLKESWRTESKKNISKIQNSWVGSDCELYTSRLTSMDNKVNNTISALELLCSTYEKARDLILESQKKSTNAINNM